MTASLEAESITFEGVGAAAGAEIIGGTLASFLLQRPDQHDREVGVILNDPGAEFLAGLLGQEDSPAVREKLAAIVGRLWIERLVRQGRHVDAVIFLSKARLAADSEFIEAVRKAFPAAS